MTEKADFMFRKCAKTHLQQCRTQKFFRGLYPGPPLTRGVEGEKGRMGKKRTEGKERREGGKGRGKGRDGKEAEMGLTPTKPKILATSLKLCINQGARPLFLPEGPV